MASEYVSDFPAKQSLGQFYFDMGLLTADGSASALTQTFSMNTCLRAFAVEIGNADKTAKCACSGQTVTFDGLTAAQTYHVIVFGK